MNRLAPYLVALSLAACGVDVPDQPTWTEHVRPILAANCIRCHGPQATGGAPNTFRLDTYDDTFRLDGTPVRGASTMAQFIATRAGEMGEMPPDWPRTDEQRDILVNWWSLAEQAGPGVLPELGPFRASDAPTAVAIDVPGTADADPVTVAYEITDPDGDLVTGSLFVGSREVSRDLVDGRGSVTFDPSSFPDDTYDVIARISDDIDEVDITLGTIDIAHASGNVAPRVTIAASPDGIDPMRDVLVAPNGDPADPTFPVFLLIADPDAGDTHTVDLIAFRGAIEEPIEENLAVTTGAVQYDWDASGFDFATNWRLRAVVDDGTTTTVAETGPFIVSDATTAVPFSDVQTILGDRCLPCHGDTTVNVPNVSTFTLHGSVQASSGRIYRRVVQEHTMPPPSVHGILDGYEDITDAERATLADYLLGGAPAP